MSRLRVFTACCACAAFATVVAAADPVMTAGADVAATRRVAREAEQKLHQSLHKKIKAEWIDATIEGVLTGIAEDASIPVWIDKQSLQDNGINIDAPLTLNIGVTTVWQALRFLLSPFELTWEAPEGVLEVTTNDKANEHFYTRAYDVSPIVKALEAQPANHLGTPRHFRVRPQVPLSVVIGWRAAARMPDVHAADDGQAPPIVFAQFGGIAGNGIVETPPGNGPFGTVTLPANPVGDRGGGSKIGESGPRTEIMLADLLKTCTRAQWDGIDDAGGTIAVVPGRLIIRQGYQAHIEIQALLTAIENLFQRGTKTKSQDVRRPAYPHDEDARLIQRLAEPFTIDASDQPLADVVQSVATLTGVRLWIEVQALADEGISTDTQVTLKQSGLPLNTVLKYLLEPLGIVAVVDEGTLVITTKTRADSSPWQSIRIYNTANITGIGPEDIVAAVESSGGQNWEHMDGDGGAHYSLGSRLLVVRQSQNEQSAISSLLDDLRKNSDPKQEPAAPKLEQRIYPVTDSTAIADLIRSLPDLVPNWDARQGSIHRLGECLMVNQSALAHERVGEIIGAINAAHERLHPPPPAITQPSPAPPATVPVPMQPQPAAQPPVLNLPADPAKPRIDVGERLKE